MKLTLLITSTLLAVSGVVANNYGCGYRDQDEVQKCFYKSKYEAEKYCSTKITKATRYETTYITRYEYPTETETVYKTTTKCKEYGGGHRRAPAPAPVFDTGAEDIVARAPIPAPAIQTNEARAFIDSSNHVEVRVEHDVEARDELEARTYGGSPPSCLDEHADESKITAACSCIGVKGGYETKYSTVYTTETKSPVITYYTKWSTKWDYKGKCDKY